MRLHPGNKILLVIPDLHTPLEHPDAFNFIKLVAKTHKPQEIISLGDECDQHALSSKYAHDPDGDSAGAEMHRAVEHLLPWYKLFPKVKVCTSNHGTRAYKTAMAAGLPNVFLRDLKKVLEAPRGWQWADKWIVDNIHFQHGEGYSGKTAAVNSAIDNMESTVIGHLHSHAGIHYHATREKMIWGFNSGCLIDISAYVFAYGKNSRYKPTLGCGIIRYGIPYFIPMQLDKRNRWKGVI